MYIYYFVYHLCTVESTMTASTILGVEVSCNASFIVRWTLTAPDHNYIVTWTNLRTGVTSSVTAPENTSGYTITVLTSLDLEYNVTVTAYSSCGMKASDPYIVDCKHVCVYVYSYIIRI